jgi:hypothetical protein
MSRKSRWSDASPGKKAIVLITGSLQFALAIAAWSDLAKRPARQVRGPKRLWAAIIAINWVGPIAYFMRGRQLSD